MVHSKVFLFTRLLDGRGREAQGFYVSIIIHYCDGGLLSFDGRAVEADWIGGVQVGNEDSDMVTHFPFRDL